MPAERFAVRALVRVGLDGADLVVLATGMVPVTALGPDILKEAKPAEEKKEEKKAKPEKGKKGAEPEARAAGPAPASKGKTAPPGNSMD